jgi:hypothetical protein
MSPEWTPKVYSGHMGLFRTHGTLSKIACEWLTMIGLCGAVIRRAARERHQGIEGEPPRSAVKGFVVLTGGALAERETLCAALFAVNIETGNKWSSRP